MELDALGITAPERGKKKGKCWNGTSKTILVTGRVDRLGGKKKYSACKGTLGKQAGEEKDERVRRVTLYSHKRGPKAKVGGTVENQGEEAPSKH